MVSLIRAIMDIINPPVIEIIGIFEPMPSGIACMALHEGKWISGKFPDNIRLDRDTHFDRADDDAVHAHVYGRNKRNGAVVVVRKDGSASHKQPGKLHDDDADALRARGFSIGRDNLVEWLEMPIDERMLISEAFDDPIC